LFFTNIRIECSHKQTAGPIGEQIRFIQQHHRAVLPLGKFEQKRCLADLSRIGQQLDARRRRISQPPSQEFATFAVTEPELL
jgi:hypothetical protein